MQAIAKPGAPSVAEVTEAIGRWAGQVITDNARKHRLALELAGLDELQEVFYARA